MYESELKVGGYPSMNLTISPSKCIGEISHIFYKIKSNKARINSVVEKKISLNNKVLGP